MQVTLAQLRKRKACVDGYNKLVGHLRGVPYTPRKTYTRWKHDAPKAVKWYAFDSAKGSHQKRPPERKLVLVRLASAGKGLPEGIAIGYMKNAAGDKQSPYFVVPGLHTGTALAWCDCLPDGFKWPSR